MRFLPVAGALLLAPVLQAQPSAALPEDKKPKPDPPCTVHSLNTGSFFDLNPISIRSDTKEKREESWLARGYDYSVNFTLNFCAPVVEDLKEVVGLEQELWGNVSAFYKEHGKIYSIGYVQFYPSGQVLERAVDEELIVRQLSTTPIFRGRKLVLNYTDGSPCGPQSSGSIERRKKNVPQDKDKPKGKPKDKPHDKPKDDEDEGDENDGGDGNDEKHKDKKPVDEKNPVKQKPVTQRKSTLISLLCDRDPLAPKASVAFIGASPDECAYFFEVRSLAACGGASDSRQTVGPGGVFGIIALIACLVYLIGGCVYQRTVMHARGWRQLPNYSMWAGIGSFISDIFTILLSSCTRFFPRRNGYRNLPTSIGGTGRRRSADAENRLIDQYDEEWDD